MKRIAILGSTGSIGKNACRVADALKDQVQVTALAANSSVELLAAQARHFNCKAIALFDPGFRLQLEKEQLPAGCKVFYGPEGLLELAQSEDVDMILCSIIGTAGLLPVMEAIRAGKEIALASKEVMVMAGQTVMDLVRKHNTKLIPVDSEHSAIFQCLGSLDSSHAINLILTSSGGPFRNASMEEMRQATFAKAVAHPVWSMGQKISIDSASLMNKALEMIEAHFLFNCPEERIQVVVHPQSIIHSMIELQDGAVMAQLGVPDMRLPIQLAFTWPERLSGGLDHLDLVKAGHLDFFEPDAKRFPSLGYAREAIREGGTMPCVLNAANEAAYVRFKNEEIGFLDIYKVIEETMQAHNNIKNASFEDILEADRKAREFAASVQCKGEK